MLPFKYIFLFHTDNTSFLVVVPANIISEKLDHLNVLTIELNKPINHRAAKRFFKKALWSIHVSKTRTITVDKNLAYPIAITKLKKKNKILLGIQIKLIKYLNNIVEQEHYFIKNVHTLC